MSKECRPASVQSLCHFAANTERHNIDMEVQNDVANSTSYNYISILLPPPHLSLKLSSIFNTLLYIIMFTLLQEGLSHACDIIMMVPPTLFIVFNLCIQISVINQMSLYKDISRKS